jgi:hypothetical protein
MNAFPVLMSYALLRRGQEKVRNMLLDGISSGSMDVLLDSGAFTAYKQGSIIEVGEYGDFLSKNSFPKCFSLDVIGNADATMKNYLELVKSFPGIIPVFTRGAPLEHLDLYAKHSDYIALGGIAVKAQGVQSYVKYFMNHVKLHYPNLKIHWFGWGDRDYLLYFKPHSYDSSSWVTPRMFGRLDYLKNNRMKSFTYPDANKFLRTPEVLSLLNKLGRDPVELLNRENWSGSDSINSFASFLSYFTQTDDLKTYIGTQTYLVYGNEGGSLLEKILNLWKFAHE